MKKFSSLTRQNAHHIKVLNGEMGIVQKDISVIRNDVKWIKRIGGAIIALLLAKGGIV